MRKNITYKLKNVNFDNFKAEVIERKSTTIIRYCHITLPIS